MQLPLLQNPLIGGGGRKTRSLSELMETATISEVTSFPPASREDRLEDRNLLPLPPQFDYLRCEVERCRVYLQEINKVVEGRGYGLCLDPLPCGKSHTLVLDLDETMVFTYSYQDGVPISNGEIRPTGEPDIKLCFDRREGLFEHDVWYRPGLLPFLAAVSKHYEILVFSEGLEDYVKKVLYGFVDPHKEYISRVFSKDDLSTYDTRKRIRNVGIQFEELVSLKDISGFFIGPHARRHEQVVCVDDKVSNFVNNLDNLVPVPPFKGDADDKELCELCWFLIALTKVTDVRKEIKKRCDLHALLGSQSRYHTLSSPKDKNKLARVDEVDDES